MISAEPDTIIDKFTQDLNFSLKGKVADLLATCEPHAPSQGRPDIPFEPEAVSARWQERDRPQETPPDFIKRHYGKWLGRGLTRSDIRKVDPHLYRALYGWLRNNELPSDFVLPTLAERGQELVARAFQSVGLTTDASISDLSASPQAKALLSALRRYDEKARDR